MERWRDGGGGLALYGATLALELPAVWARAYLAYAVVWFWSETQGVPAAYRWPLAALVAFAPLGWSASALVWPAASGIWWRQRIGGRVPSAAEREALGAAAAELGVAPPRRWFVVDDLAPRAAVCGDALMLTRQMVDDAALPAVLAHELGHLATLDARLAAALDNLVLWTPRERRGRRGAIRALGAALVWLVRGGLGLRVTAAAWGAWWREREYRADDYARALGKGEELALHLEQEAMLDDRPVPFMWASGQSYPPASHRVDRLRRASGASAARAPRERSAAENVS